MDEKSTKTRSIEQYLEDTIIEYLKSQNDVVEGQEYNFTRINAIDQTDIEERQKTILIIEELLEDILHNVDRSVLYQEEYKKAGKQHPQYGLFNLDDVLSEFVLDDTLTRQLCFRETLLISNVDLPQSQPRGRTKPQSVGGFCLKIESVRGFPPSKPPREEPIDKHCFKRIIEMKKELVRSVDAGVKESNEDKLEKYKEFLKKQTEQASQKFVVHLSSEFDVEGLDAGSRITSWVDRDFHTLEERRTEHISNDNGPSNKQILYYALQKNKYYIKHLEKFDKIHETRKYYSFSKTKDLIGEGANFILMRYLALTRYKGTFELSAMYINGDMCRNIYECKGPRPGYVNGSPVDVCKIYRSIIEECGIMHSSVTIMTVYGMIIRQEWEGCPYIIQMNPQFVTEGKPTPYDYIALKNIWETNIEMVSKYLDCKVEAELKMKTYLKDHPEVHNMMADYLQSILLLKPDNIMPFTIDYFSNFEPFKLPQMTYFTDFNENTEKDENVIFW